MDKIPLKDHSSLSQMRTVQRASERVSSWPEWKRSTILYRLAELNRELDIPGSEVPAEIERMAPGVVRAMAAEAVRVEMAGIGQEEGECR